MAKRPDTILRNKSLENREKVRKALLGKKLSIEHRRKLGLAQKLRFKLKPTWNKGKRGGKCSEEHKRKISLGNKGKIRTEEMRLNYSIAKKGIKLSEETKKKMSEISKKLGRKPPSRLGQRLNEAQKLKLRGKNSWKWKGGKIPLNRLLRQRTEYKNWQLEVFKRDWYRCFDCGEKSKKLEAHHVYSWKDYPRLRFEIHNGLTLCRDCHLKQTIFQRKGIVVYN